MSRAQELAQKVRDALDNAPDQGGFAHVALADLERLAIAAETIAGREPRE